MKPADVRPAVARRRRLPVWLWVTPLVLAAHALLFWLVADRQFLPKPWRGGTNAPATATTTRPEEPFSAREEPVSDPQTGEPATRREFTIPTRLAHPPSPSPAPAALP